MPQAIVNADDFGLTVGVTQGIVECSRHTMLSTSAMVCIKGASALVRTYAPVFKGSIGLHLQLTQGTPVLSPADIPSLVGEDGQFPPRRPKPAARPVEVAAEWRAQFDTLRTWGIDPDHIDCHHSIYSHPDFRPLLHVAAAVAKDYGLPLRAHDRVESAALRSIGIACADVSVSLSKLGSSLPRLLAALRSEQAKGPANLTVELVCHPGICEPELVSCSKYAQQREKELKLLTNEDTLVTIKNEGWDLVQHSELRASNREILLAIDRID